MNDYHRKPSIAVSNEAQKQCSTPDRNLSYVFDDHRLEQSREPKKTEKSTYFTKYNYDWNGPKVSSNVNSPIKTDSTGPKLWSDQFHFRAVHFFAQKRSVWSPYTVHF